MNNNNIFNKENIFLDIDINSSDELLEYIANQAKKLKICNNQKGLILKLKEREEISSTGFENQIAISHTQYEQILKSALFFIRLKNPIDWKAMDGGLSKYFFTILVPKNDDNQNQHIEILGNLAAKMLDRNFLKVISITKNKQQIIDLIFQQEEQSISLNDNQKKDYYLAVSTCTFGLAHTYIAEQKILQYGKENNFDIKVETHGAKGDKNLITLEDLEKAKGVLIACDKDINLDHITHDNVYKVRTVDAVNNTKHCFDVLQGKVKVSKAKQNINNFFKLKLHQSASHCIGKTYNFIRYFALMMGILLFINSFLPENNFIVKNQLISIIAISSFIVAPLFSFLLVKFFTKSETTAIAAGVIIFIVSIYNNYQRFFNISYTEFLSFGLIGVLLISSLAILYHKYIYKLNKVIFKNRKIRGGFQWFLQIALVILMFFTIFYSFTFFSKVNSKIFISLINWDQSYWWFRFIIASLFLYLMTIDMGGPINKWTIFISALFMTESFAVKPTQVWLTPITAQVLGITMPGIAIWVRGYILNNKLTNEEKSLSLEAGKKAFNGISEGALWFNQKYKWKAHLSNLLLAIYCGFIIGFLHIQTYGGYNTILGTIFGFSTDNVLQKFGLDYMSFNIGFFILTFTGPIVGGLFSSIITYPIKEKK